jgi:RNA polymerase sigma-70 factor (ECF subfamily)
MAHADSANERRQTLYLEIEGERSYLIRFAMAKLRDPEVAEEVVQEATVAALAGIDSFAGDSSLRTWLTGILKFKIIDHQRRVVTERERYASQPGASGEDDGSGDWMDELFDETGHWRAEFGTWAMPEAAHEQKAFFAAFERCLDRLPPTTARVFFQREVIGEETENICKEEGITASNCWVILHRARVGLRECLEIQWFGR